MSYGTIYIFVRADLGEEDQLIQSNHATFSMCSVYRADGLLHRVIALDGGASKKAFERLLRKLSDKKVPYIAYADPDHPEWGVTAICTPPLTDEESLPLSNYRLRRYSPVAQLPECHSAPSAERDEDVGAIPTGRANLEWQKP